MLFQLFGPVLFSAHVYGSSQLVGTRSLSIAIVLLSDLYTVLPPLDIPQRLNWKSFLAAPEDCTIKEDNLSKSKQWNKILYFVLFNNLFLNYFNTLLFKREGTVFTNIFSNNTCIKFHKLLLKNFGSVVSLFEQSRAEVDCVWQKSEIVCVMLLVIWNWKNVQNMM